jgi:indolepyruvate ferredoxin oxidoreductase beta subunit
VTRPTNIMLVGVGGQGIVLAGEVLAHVLMLAGHDVKKSETHGMAQRGGSVRSDVRFGSKVFSPTIPPGRADILVAFEQLEALRHLNQLGRDGSVIASTQRIVPTTAYTGPNPYPDDIPAAIAKAGFGLCEVDAPALAAEAGNPRAAGTCLLAALSWHLPVAQEVWDTGLGEAFPQKIREVNLRAFSLGREATRPGDRQADAPAGPG